MTYKDDDSKKENGSPLPEGRPKSIRTLVEEFKVDLKLSVNARAAQFFDYLAQKAPYQYCPPNLALKAAMGFAKTPRETSDEVLKFRGRGSAIREVLRSTYGRGFDVDRRLGLMRASVDSEDLAKTQQAKNIGRLRSAVDAARKTGDMIKVSEIRDPAVRSWIKGGVTPLIKALTEDDRIFRLMPAKPKDPKDE